MTTKEQVLESLQLKTGEYVSGSQIASHLNISRNAVWKAIEQLRADGYKIEAVTHKGYRLTALSEKLVPDNIANYLKNLGVAGKDLVPIYFYNEISSTNTKAKEHISAGAVHGTAVIARTQTAGKLDATTSFPSPPGNIYMSVIFRPSEDHPIETIKSIHMCVAAIYKALKDQIGIECEVRDVDNLYYNGKKICGLFTEGSGTLKSGVRVIATNILGICVYTKGTGINRALLAARILKNLIYDKPNPEETEVLYQKYCEYRQGRSSE